MSRQIRCDAIVVGAGPNGLAAAITLAQVGRSVVVYEASEMVGGGSRTQELTLPGFRHDVCSAIHPLGVGSPFFRSLPLARYGLEWVYPPAPLAHPLDDGAAVLERSLGAMEASLGKQDAAAWRNLFAPFVEEWESLAQGILGPLRPGFQLAHPMISLQMARFAVSALQPARMLAERTFHGERARALFGGMAAHAMLPLERPVSAAIALVLGTLGHVIGWPFPKGGSQTFVDALAAHLRTLGGEIVTGVEVTSLRELPSSRVVLFDLTPRQVLRIAGDSLPEGYRQRLGTYRYGPGVFKVDYALDGPIPWKDGACARAGTVHLGGTLEEIASAEQSVSRGIVPEQPFVLLAQQSLFDATRAPEGKHTAWAYCHVPNGSKVDMTARIEAQIERFAPGFGDRILARHTLNPAQMEAYNANYIGGDINGGVQDLGQLFTRPVARLDPYATPNKRLYICSSSTPPGGGVHGMCGYYAARSALRSALA
ncbi:MAG TPA: NAD(P)/FAD-dependent oxidoreductase [Ktedonobacterales bacterium]|jgi:phytoene dehydrogenase-like protein